MRFRICGFLAALVASIGVAHGAYVGSLIDYAGGLNTVYTTGLAAAYDSNKNPRSGYNWSQLDVGDIVVVILKATKVVSPVTGTGGKTDDAYTGELTKYLALQVASKTGDEYGSYTFQAGGSDGWDPFGVLKAGEVMGIWLEGTKDFTVNAPIYGNKNGNRSDEVDWATDGTLFATFRLNNFIGYYNPLSLTLSGGLDVVQNPLNLQWLGVSNPLGGIVDLAIDSLTLSGGASSQTDWDFFASDAESFRVTPEPGTVMALLAMGGAAGLGLALRRRKES